jgi:hypothetical protein
MPYITLVVVPELLVAATKATPRKPEASVSVAAANKSRPRFPGNLKGNAWAGKVRGWEGC